MSFYSICFPEDELQNVELAEDERTRKNNELKLKKREYTGYDDEEFVPGNEGMKRSVLAKYDEDLNGTPDAVRIISAIYSPFSLTYLQGFRLGGGTEKSNRPTRQMKEEEAARVNKSLLSIDYTSKCVACFSSRMLLTS